MVTAQTALDRRRIRHASRERRAAQAGSQRRRAVLGVDGTLRSGGTSLPPVPVGPDFRTCQPPGDGYLGLVTWHESRAGQPTSRVATKAIAGTGLSTDEYTTRATGGGATARLAPKRCREGRSDEHEWPSHERAARGGTLRVSSTARGATGPAPWRWRRILPPPSRREARLRPPLAWRAMLRRARHPPPSPRVTSRGWREQHRGRG